MELYPVMLNIHNEKAVVIGGGRVAFRKISGLLKAGAIVTVISPDLHVNVMKLVSEKKVRWHRKEFEQADLAAAIIVVAATDNKEVNEQVAQYSSNIQLMNVVDNQEMSSFHVPAKLNRGKLTIAVSTAGASPTLARNIRDELALIYDESYEDYLEFLTYARKEVLSKVCSEKKKKTLLTELANVENYKKVENQKRFFERMAVADGET